MLPYCTTTIQYNHHTVQSPYCAIVILTHHTALRIRIISIYASFPIYCQVGRSPSRAQNRRQSAPPQDRSELWSLQRNRQVHRVLVRHTAFYTFTILHSTHSPYCTLHMHHTALNKLFILHIHHTALSLHIHHTALSLHIHHTALAILHSPYYPHHTLYILTVLCTTHPYDRYKYLRETAFEHAFVLDQIGALTGRV
jgi:hypothetical protein